MGLSPMQYSFNRWLNLGHPIGLLEAFPEKHCHLKLLLPNPFTFFISFHRCQTWSFSEGSPSLFMLLLSLFFTGVFSNNSHVHLIFLDKFCENPNWHKEVYYSSKNMHHSFTELSQRNASKVIKQGVDGWLYSFLPSTCKANNLRK